MKTTRSCPAATKEEPRIELEPGRLNPSVSNDGSKVRTEKFPEENRFASVATRKALAHPRPLFKTGALLPVLESDRKGKP